MSEQAITLHANDCSERQPLVTLRDLEARHIACILEHTRGQISEAARILGIHRNTVTRKIREYGL